MIGAAMSSTATERPPLVEERHVRRELDGLARLERARDGAPVGRPRLVDQPEDLGERPTGRLGLAPADEPLGDGVHERDPLARVGRDDRVADRAQGGGEPALTRGELRVHRVLVERDLDRDAELAVVEGLEEVRVRARLLGAREGRVVGVRGEVDDGQVPARPERRRRVDAVDGAAQLDVHEDERGSRGLDGLQRLGASPDREGDVVAEPLQRHLQVVGDDALVFHNQDRRCHEGDPTCGWVFGNVRT
jgi:hypothetical protein